MTTEITITSVEFENYKALSKYRVNIGHMNIIVGPNNAGKSTVISAFRILAVAVRHARQKSPQRVETDDGFANGYSITQEQLPISLENVHTDYANVSSRIRFVLSNKNLLTLYFPEDGGCFLLPQLANGRVVQRPAEFKAMFPITIAVVPVLGPVEHKEQIVTTETVRQYIHTHRASRHFRNYWHNATDGFDEFASLVRRTWTGMEVSKPVRTDPLDKTLAMFCEENRISRELYWCGSGFQVWCQMLTHLARVSQDTIVVVDEPEIYLHADVQRQLVKILRDAGPDVLLATHSTEIMAEADPNEIIVIDKNQRQGQRLKDINGVQRALDSVGSLQNITLASIARNNRILFTEDAEDFRIIKKFADKLGFSDLSNGLGLTQVNAGGFPSWKRIIGMSWGLEQTMKDSLRIGVIYDSDFYCTEEIEDIIEQLDHSLNFAHIHKFKEIENYLLVPNALDRAIEYLVADRVKRYGESGVEVTSCVEDLEAITHPMKADVFSQYIAKRQDYITSKKREGRDNSVITQETLRLLEKSWGDLGTRLQIVSGKAVLKQLRDVLKQKYGINMSDTNIIGKFRRDEIPDDMAELLQKLEKYRLT